MRYYAGIGSRSTPKEIQTHLTKLAQELAARDYVLRSGGAVGADAAFERGADKKEIFRSKDTRPWAYDEAKKCLPNDRAGFDYWKPYVRGLIARNMMQVLGADGDSPVDFVLCWAPSNDYADSSAGGTGYAIRCALRHNIQVINFYGKEEWVGALADTTGRTGASRTSG